MKLTAQEISESTLVLARPNFRNLNPPGCVTIANRFSTFLIEALSRHDQIAVVVVDGSLLRVEDPKATRINLLRSLMNRNRDVQFFVFSDEELSEFALRNANLTVIPRRLNEANAARELRLILDSVNWHRSQSRSVN